MCDEGLTGAPTLSVVGKQRHFERSPDFLLSIWPKIVRCVQDPPVVLLQGLEHFWILADGIDVLDEARCIL
jgi:hypothetical protein